MVFKCKIKKKRNAQIHKKMRIDLALWNCQHSFKKGSYKMHAATKTDKFYIQISHT